MIIQIKDDAYNPEDHSFIIDGQGQFSGAAIQVWANAGFMVLFTPDPLLAEGTSEKQEDDRETEHIEEGIDLLDSQGLIDRNKIAITGWSRAGWYSEYVMTHAKTHFAAAGAWLSELICGSADRKGGLNMVRSEFNFEFR
ncbi:MAG TPA: prolyl oligopeptidase family serine peptidase [Candidatus Acidoferrales bacterium]|nr:prolyl oligopeptidase family serine peptidase [Candidatus Acidoferrales bacterium]